MTGVRNPTVALTARQPIMDDDRNSLAQACLYAVARRQIVADEFLQASICYRGTLPSANSPLR